MIPPRNPTDPAEWGGKLNIYTCDVCRAHIVTRDVDDGVTPFSLMSKTHCPNKCEAQPSIKAHPLPAMMTSSMYRVWDQSMAEDYQWFKPTGDLLHLSRWERDHVEKGGLLIRPVVKS